MNIIKGFFYLIVFAAIALIGGLGVLYHLYNTQLPDVDELGDVSFKQPLHVYDRNGGLIAEYAEQRRFPVTFDEVPQVVIDAFVAAEDGRFFEHDGVDLRGLTRAAVELVRTGDKTQGGSTITMQVARNFYLTREQTYSRKLFEILLAFKIEQQLEKEEILALYLNKIFLGQRAYGIKAAAQVYFDKTLDELDIAEAAMLAALPKAPSTVNPVRNPERAIGRRTYVLDRMLHLGMITQREFEQAVDAALPGRTFGRSDIETRAPYVAEMVRSEMVARYGDDAYTMGLDVYTTLDPLAQAAARSSLRQNLLEYDQRHGYRGPEDDFSRYLDQPEQLTEQLESRPTVGGLLPAVVLSVDSKHAEVQVKELGNIELTLDDVRWACRYQDEDNCGPRPSSVSDVLTVGDLIRIRPPVDEEDEPGFVQIPDATAALVALDSESGAIRALVGGFDFFNEGQFNNVTQAERQSGSGFKPFLYSAALDAGYSWNSLFNDSPVIVKDGVRPGVDWRPQNYGRDFGGMRTMRESLERSVNLISIRLIEALGAEQVRQYVGQFGLPVERWDPTPAMALGSYTQTPLELTTGYAAFANGGYRVQPYLISEIESPNHGSLFSQPMVQLCPDCPPDTSDPSMAPSIISEQTAFLMRSGLRSIVRSGTGARAGRELGRRDIGGKTGTTNAQRDAWFAGFGPDYTVTAWMGFKDNRPLGRRETGGQAALPMWINFMRQVLPPESEDTADPPPEGIVSAWVNRETGEGVEANAPGAIREYFDSTNPDVVIPQPAPQGSGGGTEVIDELF